MNKHVIRYTLGKMIRIEGLLMLLPALVGLIYREKTGFVYLGAGSVVKGTIPDNVIVFGNPAKIYNKSHVWLSKQI